jgi:hypothetical protein
VWEVGGHTTTLQNRLWTESWVKSFVEERQQVQPDQDRGGEF